MESAMTASLWLFGIDRTPAGSGDEFAGKRSAWAGGFTWFALVERTARAHLFGFVLRIFGSVHFLGVFLVAKCDRGRIGFFEFDRRWRWCLTECARTEEGGCSDGYNEFGKEITACVHGDVKCEISYGLNLFNHSEKMHVQTFDLRRIFDDFRSKR